MHVRCALISFSFCAFYTSIELNFYLMCICYFLLQGLDLFGGDDVPSKAAAAAPQPSAPAAAVPPPPPPAAVVDTRRFADSRQDESERMVPKPKPSHRYTDTRQDEQDAPAPRAKTNFPPPFTYVRCFSSYYSECSITQSHHMAHVIFIFAGRPSMRPQLPHPPLQPRPSRSHLAAAHPQCLCRPCSQVAYLKVAALASALPLALWAPLAPLLLVLADSAVARPCLIKPLAVALPLALVLVDLVLDSAVQQAAAAVVPLAARLYPRVALPLAPPPQDAEHLCLHHRARHLIIRMSIKSISIRTLLMVILPFASSASELRSSLFGASNNNNNAGGLFGVQAASLPSRN